MEEVEFIDVKMQTAIRLSYDHDKRLDENLQEYKIVKQLQDESDQVNFLRQPASGEAVETAFKQSLFWYNMKRGFGNGAKVWMPNKCRVESIIGTKSKKQGPPRQERWINLMSKLISFSRIE